MFGNMVTEAMLSRRQAISWAISQDVDVISISLGFSGTVDLAIREAVANAQKLRKDGSQVLIFAAASNVGANSSSAIAYPARLTGVFCIFSASTFGKESTFSPKETEDTYPNLSTLGEYVTSAWPACKGENPKDKNPTHVYSGTSVATPIAAGIAALIIEFGKNAEAKGVTDLSFVGLGTHEGMRSVLQKIANEKTHFLSSQIFEGREPPAVGALISEKLWDAGFRSMEK
jgi:subtilisin family serine protease